MLPMLHSAYQYALDNGDRIVTALSQHLLLVAVPLAIMAASA